MEEQEDRSVKFAYFQAYTEQGTGYVCVALKRPPKNSVGEDNVYVAGFSFCSPKDARHFNKKRARIIAQSRIEGNSKTCVSLIVNDQSTLGNIFTDVLELSTRTSIEKQDKDGKIMKYKVAPNWLVKSWHNGLVDFGLRQWQNNPPILDPVQAQAQ